MRLANGKLTKATYTTATATGPILASYLLATGAPLISYTAPVLLSLMGLSTYKHYDYVKKRAGLAKALLLELEKKGPALEKIEMYSKRGRKAHLIAATSKVSLLASIPLLFNPSISLLCSPLYGYILTSLCKIYKIAYYTPLKWLKKKLQSSQT